MNEALALDEIDRIVDTVIENPVKAAKLKEALHSKSFSRLTTTGVARMRQSYDDSVDDLWDNVPV